jgi:hypothetical protein
MIVSFLAAISVREKRISHFFCLCTFFRSKSDIVLFNINSLFFLSPVGPREALSRSKSIPRLGPY